MHLSGRHKIEVRKGVWTDAATEHICGNKRVHQHHIGDEVTYYHIQCPNFLTDNIIAEGTVVESYGTRKSIKKDTKYVYTWSNHLKGFTRIGNAMSSKCSVS